MIQHAEKLGDVHPDLRRLMLAVAQKIDVLIAVGHRDADAQMVAFHTGKSEVPWPKSKHNALPSLAVDVVPLPVDWKDIAGFNRMAEVIKQTAAELQIEIVWGGDWHTIKDRDHIELVDEPGGSHGGSSGDHGGGPLSA